MAHSINLSVQNFLSALSEPLSLVQANVKHFHNSLKAENLKVNFIRKLNFKKYDRDILGSVLEGSSNN